MVVGERIRQLRESKKMSQGDIEKRTGLLRCYISRVENGHTVPSIETIEKLAAALEIPLYRFFYEGIKAAQVPEVLGRAGSSSAARRGNAEGAKFLRQLGKYLAKLEPRKLQMLIVIANRMASRGG